MSLLPAAADSVAQVDLPHLDRELQMAVGLDLQPYDLRQIRTVEIAYRAADEQQFQRQILTNQGLRVDGKVDLSGFSGKVVEYFFSVEATNGTREYFPRGAPYHDLLQVVVGNRQRDSASPKVVLISPDAGEVVYTDEVVITASFFALREVIDPASIHLRLNDWDVSKYVRLHDGFLTFAPRKVVAGNYTIVLELFSTDGQRIAEEKWDCQVVERVVPPPVSDIFGISGRFFTEVRQEALHDGDSRVNYSFSGLQVQGSNRRLVLGSRIFFSNQERSNRQAVNRFSAWARLAFWNGRFLRTDIGDVYSQMSPFLMQNVVVRGLRSELNLKFINFEGVYGYTRRSIDGAQLTDSAGVVVDTLNGNYQRNLRALRASIGGRQNFQLGLTVTRGKDDITTAQLAQPAEESFALGADVYLSGSGNRITLEGSYNVSAYNPDIGDGRDVSLDSLERLGISYDRDIYERVANFITVNQNAIIEPATAYSGRLRLNILKNNLTAEYRYIEEAFYSLGQPFLLRDFSGLIINDNIRLYQNQLFLNLRFQQSENNLARIKPATTTTRNIGVNVAYFPFQNVPSINIGYTNLARDNSLTSSAVPMLPLESITNIVNVSTSYAFTVTKLDNRLTLNVVNYNRNDRTNFGVDNLSSTAGLILQTNYHFPLRTTLEFNFQQTDNYLTSAFQDSSEYAFNSFGLGADYRFGGLLHKVDALDIGFRGRYGIVTTDLVSRRDGSRLVRNEDYNRVFLNARMIYNHPTMGKLSINSDLVNYSGDRRYSDLILSARFDLSF